MIDHFLARVVFITPQPSHHRLGLCIALGVYRNWGESLGWDNLQLTHLPFAAAYGLSASGFGGGCSILSNESISTGSGKTMVVFFSTPISVSVCR